MLAILKLPTAKIDFIDFLQFEAAFLKTNYITFSYLLIAIHVKNISTVLATKFRSCLINFFRHWLLNKNRNESWNKKELFQLICSLYLPKSHFSTSQYPMNENSANLGFVNNFILVQEGAVVVERPLGKLAEHKTAKTSSIARFI